MAEDPTRAWLPAGATAAVAALIGLTAIWLVPMVAGTDTPTHLAFAMLLANPEPAAGLIATSFAPTSQLFVWLAVPFVGLGVATAAKIAISLTFAVYLLGAIALGATLTGRSSLAAPIAAASFFGFSFAMGFFNFTLAAGFGMAMMAAGVTTARSPTLRNGVLLALIGALTLHAHVIVYGMFFVQSAVLAVWYADRLRLRTSALAFGLALLPSALASLWLVAAVSGALADTGTAAGLGVQRLAWGEQLTNLWYTTFGGLSPLAGITAVAALVLAFGGAGRRGATVLGLSLTLWVAVYALVPFHVAGWAFAQPRALLPLVAVLVGFASLPRLGRGAPLLAVGLTVLQVASAWPTMWDDGRRTADAVEALGTDATGRALIVRMDGGEREGRRYVLPLLHVAQYAVGRGGVDPDWETMNPVIHAIRAAVVPQPPRLPPFLFVGRNCALNEACAFFGQAAADRAFVVASSFDTVLVTGGSDDELALFDARGFARLAPSRFAAPTLRRIDATLEVLAPQANTPLVIRLVFPNTVGAYAGVSVPAGPARTLTGIPVGPVPEGNLIVEVTTERGDVLSRVPIDVSGSAPLTLPLTLRTGN